MLNEIGDMLKIMHVMWMILQADKAEDWVIQPSQNLLGKW